MRRERGAPVQAIDSNFNGVLIQPLRTSEELEISGYEESL